MNKTCLRIAAFVLLLALSTMDLSFAEKANIYILADELSRKKVQLDTGFVYEEVLDKDDPHYGWGLGEFFIKGYTSMEIDQNGLPVFYKDDKDKLLLGFNLKQSIDALNGNKNYRICEDINGYDAFFEVNQTNFGRGCFIIVRTDDENNKDKPRYHTNYLMDVQKGDPTTVYEVSQNGFYYAALDYEVEYPGFLGKANHNNYTTFFAFRVVNKIPTASGLRAATVWDGVSKELLAATAGTLLLALIIVAVMSIRSRKLLINRIHMLEASKQSAFLNSGDVLPRRLETGDRKPDDY